MAEWDGLSLSAALAQFRRAQGLTAGHADAASWTCRIGPLVVRLPNFRWRRQAIIAHDVHHLLTGYPCTMRGELQMAAWECGAGRMPHWGATLFCLPLLLMGVCWSPRRLFAAFRRGRRSHSLHGLRDLDALLEESLSAVQIERAPRPAGQVWSDAARFAFLLLHAVLLVLSAPAFIVAAWAI